MTEIWLIRHGQTDWNLARRFQGQSDIALNQTGIRQAYSCADKLAKVNFEAVYASDLLRAHKTAEIISAPHKLEIKADPRLREICMGVWEGQFFDDVHAKYGDSLMEGPRDPSQPRVEGGESFLQVAQRMSAAADDIANLHPQGKVLLVSHGLAVAVLFCLARDIPITQANKYIPDNTAALQINWPKI